MQSATSNLQAPFLLFAQQLADPGLIRKVRQSKTWSFYGAADHIDTLAHDASAFVASNSDGAADEVFGPLQEFIKLARHDCLLSFNNAGALWLLVRMSPPSEEYVIPRWHRDGRMFTCSCSDVPGDKGAQVHSKYAVTLLGPATRVLEVDEMVDRALAAAGVDKNVMHRVDREKLADLFAGCGEVGINTGQAIRFSWGRDDSPIHSEPDWSGGDRVFVSVLFGSEDEIREMCAIRGEEYGRLDNS